MSACLQHVTKVSAALSDQDSSTLILNPLSSLSQCHEGAKHYEIVTNKATSDHNDAVSSHLRAIGSTGTVLTEVVMTRSMLHTIKAHSTTPRFQRAKI